MATAPATSSSISSSHSPRFRRNSGGHSRAVRAESKVAVAVPPPSPTSEPSLSLLQPEGADRHEDVVTSNAAAFESAKEKEKKSAWNKPSANGVIEVVGPVMGAVSWPALSESTKASPKPLSSADLLPIVTTSAATTSNTSTGAPLVPDGLVSSTASVVASPALPKPTVSVPNPSPSVNHAPIRQKSIKRAGAGGGNSSVGHIGGGFVNGGLVSPSSPSTLGSPKMVSDNKPIAEEQSPKESPSRNSSNWEHGPMLGGFSSQTRGGYEYHRSYSGQHRRGNNNGGGTDGASHHNNYITRRNHDRGNCEWNGHRNFTGRDVQLQQPHHSQQRVHQRHFPIQPVVSSSVPYISPSPVVQPFGSPMGYRDMSGVVYLPAPYVAPQLIYRIPDPQLHAVLLKQIEYYFSFDNLCKDVFLRQNMDDEGWVSVSVIADFNRVKQLTTDVGFILNTLHASSLIEVQGDKIRKRNDWMHWLLPPPANQFNSASSVESSDQATYDALAARLQGVGIENADINQSCLAATHSDLVFSSLSSTLELNSQSQIAKNPSGSGLGNFQAE